MEKKFNFDWLKKKELIFIIFVKIKFYHNRVPLFQYKYTFQLKLFKQCQRNQNTFGSV